jgi:hypothetical protein
MIAFMTLQDEKRNKSIQSFNQWEQSYLLEAAAAHIRDELKKGPSFTAAVIKMDDLLGTIINGGSQHNFRERTGRTKNIRVCVFVSLILKIHTHSCSLDMQSGKTRHARQLTFMAGRSRAHSSIFKLHRCEQ